MPQVTHVEWPAGDADRLQGFLEGLFGWKFDSPMPEMDYRMAPAGAGGVAVFPSDQRSGHPNFYFSTDDINRAIGTVRELGGQADDRAPVPGHGWFARCSDSEGNAFHLWQADESAG